MSNRELKNRLFVFKFSAVYLRKQCNESPKIALVQLKPSLTAAPRDAHMSSIFYSVINPLALNKESRIQAE